MKKKTSFTLDEVLLERLDKISKETMIPKARIVETAIEEVLKRLEQEKTLNAK